MRAALEPVARSGSKQVSSGGTGVALPQSKAALIGGATALGVGLAAAAAAAIYCRRWKVAKAESSGNERIDIDDIDSPLVDSESGHTSQSELEAQGSESEFSMASGRGRQTPVAQGAVKNKVDATMCNGTDNSDANLDSMPNANSKGMSLARAAQILGQSDPIQSWEEMVRSAAHAANELIRDVQKPPTPCSTSYYWRAYDTPGAKAGSSAGGQPNAASSPELEEIMSACASASASPDGKRLDCSYTRTGLTRQSVNCAPVQQHHQQQHHHQQQQQHQLHLQHQRQRAALPAYQRPYYDATLAQEQYNGAHLAHSGVEGGKGARPLDSPSLGSSNSEASADSGRGGSTGAIASSSLSPVGAQQQQLVQAQAQIGLADSTKGEGSLAAPTPPPSALAPIYEFAIPSSRVGLLIGVKGATIKEVMNQCGVHILVQANHPHAPVDHQVVRVTGTRECVNSALHSLRRRFPNNKFPDINLRPLLPAVPVQSPPLPAMVDSLKPLPMPEGVSVEVALASLQSPGHFFLVQPTHPTFPQLERLQHYMQAVYAFDTGAGAPGLPKPVQLNLLCAAPMYGQWSRAVTVEHYEESDEVLVRFVDHGGYVRMPAQDPRQIRSDFMALPFQAVECYLANVAPTGGDESSAWPAAAFDHFSSLVEQRIVEARVVTHCADDNTPMVELHATIDGTRINVAAALVAQNVASWLRSPAARAQSQQSSSDTAADPGEGGNAAAQLPQVTAPAAHPPHHGHGAMVGVC